MNPLDSLQLITVAVVAIWGIYQTRVTHRLEQQIYRLNISLDQSIQLLYRAREAVIKIHSAYIFLLECRAQQDRTQESEPTETYLTRLAEMSTFQAELRGIAFAVGDKELLELVNKGYDFERMPIEKRNPAMDEMEIRGRSQHLHTRISQLLKAATK